MISSVIKEDIESILHEDFPWDQLRASNIILTGSNGMLGRYLKIFLEECGAQVTCLYHDKTYAYESNNDVNYIFHAASPTQNYLKDPVSVCKVNTIITSDLLEVAKASNNFKKFIFFSTGDVDEVYKADLCQVYAESKRMGEMLCFAYWQQYQVPILIIRPDHTFAPTMNLVSDNRVFSEIVRCILKNDEILVKSTIAVRTFVYITDFMNGLLRALFFGEDFIYNISNPSGRTKIVDLVEKISRVYNIEYNVSNVVTNIDNRDRGALDIGNLIELGYQPKINYMDGFARVVNHFKEVGIS